jgi:hypothetical protein
MSRIDQQKIFTDSFHAYMKGKRTAGVDKASRTCAYGVRTPSGKWSKKCTCVVGNMIPKEAKFNALLKFNMDVGSMIHSHFDLVREAFGVTHISKIDIDFLLRLQSCHDNNVLGGSLNRDSFFGSMLRFAEDYVLEVPSEYLEQN